MQSRWFKGITNAEEKEKRRQEVLGYRNAFDALKEILVEDFEEGTPDYNSPSWAYEQADRNGANRMLKRVLTLIEIKE